ncbi:MAG: DUF6782 family putative metallopeptidase [Terriglobia bacterium]
MNGLLFRMQAPLLAAFLALIPIAALATSPQAGTQAQNSQLLLTQADAVFQQMSRITGLPIKAPLKKEVVQKSQITTLLEENLKSEYAPGEIHSEEASLKAFGLVPPDFDLRKFLISFYTEQAAGFYDPQRKTMFIAAWVTPAMQKVVLAHELTHALQDQNFGLKNFLEAVKQNDDATNARVAVVEGYATAAMMQSMLGSVPLAGVPSLQGFMNMAMQQDPSQFPVFAHAPFFFKFQSLFPYSVGLDFMQQVLRRGGWNDLNHLFTRPPVNTKQVFDPAIYLASEPQPTIDLPQPPDLLNDPGLKFLMGNTMGEEGYESLVGQLLSGDRAKAICPSWVADRYLVYSTPTPGYFALVSRTRWSNPQAAADFFHDYQTILAARYPRLVKDTRSGANLFMGSTDHGSVILMMSGNECRWVEGAPPAKGDGLLKWLQAL